MPALLIVDTKLKDPVAYEEYKALVRPLVEKMGGTYRARGDKIEVVEADLWSPTRVVVIEFPTWDAAKAFLDSDEYIPIKKIRHANAETTAVLVETN